MKNIFIDFFIFLSQCILFYFLYGIIKNIEYGEVLFTIPESFKGAYYLFYILSNLFLIISVLQFNVAEFIELNN